MDPYIAQNTDLFKPYAKIIDDLREENSVLRQVISDIATNLGNGSVVSVEASLPFIKELPHEVKLVCDGLRKEKSLPEIEEMLDKLSLDVTGSKAWHKLGLVEKIKWIIAHAEKKEYSYYGSNND